MPGQQALLADKFVEIGDQPVQVAFLCQVVGKLGVGLGLRFQGAFRVGEGDAQVFRRKRLQRLSNIFRNNGTEPQGCCRWRADPFC